MATSRFAITRATREQRHAAHGNARVGVVGNSTDGCFDDLIV
jgi:hypothetical protein